jgi:integrase
VHQVGPKTFEARCKYRGLNGVVARPSARGASRAAAKNALRDKLTKMTAASMVGEVTRDTRFRKVVELWLEDLDHKVEHGGRQPTTARTYRAYLNQHLVPRFGALMLREITPAAFDGFVKQVRSSMGYESAKKVKSIMSAIADFAIRRGAEHWSNPTKAVEALTAGVAEDVVAMSVEQVVAMIQGMKDYATRLDEEAAKDSRRAGRAAWRSVVWHDLPELAEAMLATGVRIGEVLALRGEDIVRGEEGQVLVVVNAHLIWVKGEGTRYLPHRKGKKPGDKGLVLEVSSWATGLFLRRKLAAGPGPLFPAIGGGWSDANNVGRRIRTAMDACGFQWVTSHVWRHTVGTLLDEADLPVSDVSGQLGNSKAVAERYYIRRRATNQRAARALEVLGRTAGG